MVSAASGQARADVLVIITSAALLLTGLQWLALRPRQPQRVEPLGASVEWLHPGLPDAARRDLQW